MAEMTFDLSAALTALLGRMETNPSEFFEDTYRWNFITQSGMKEVLTDDELKLLAEGLVYVRRAEVNSRILQALLGEPQREYEKVQYGSSIAGVLGQNAVVRTQAQQLKYDMEHARREMERANQQNNALGQNTPSDYLKSFFK